MQRVSSDSNHHIADFIIENYNFNFVECMTPYISPSNLKVMRMVSKNFKDSIDNVLVTLLNSRKINFLDLKINSVNNICCFFKNKCSSIITLNLVDINIGPLRTFGKKFTDENFINSQDLFKINYLFPNIQNLYLKRALISEYSKSYFINMTSLKKLSLYKCDEIENYTSIGTISSLTNLQISSKKINDITFLESLFLLKKLKLNLCKTVKDYTILKNLTNLTSLNLYNTNFENTSPLVNQLANLNLQETTFDNFCSLATLSKLTKLNLLYCNIGSVKFLENMPFLTKLKLSGYRPIHDIDKIASCNLLRDLTLSGCFVSINFLSLPMLTYLNISSLGYKNIQELSILTQCHSLKQISFPGKNEMSISSTFSIKDALQKFEDDLTIITDSENSED